MCAAAIAECHMPLSRSQHDYARAFKLLYHIGRHTCSCPLLLAPTLLLLLLPSSSPSLLLLVAVVLQLVAGCERPAGMAAGFAAGSAWSLSPAAAVEVLTSSTGEAVAAVAGAGVG